MALSHTALEPAPQSVSRRNLLRILWALGGLTVLAELGILFLDFFRPRKIGAFGSVITVGPATQFEVGSITRVADGKFYLSRVPEGFLALFQKCPHLGCVVPWEPAQQSEDRIAPQGRFNCPCHGSIYNRYGVIVAGPAPRPMDLMQVRINNGLIEVNTGRVSIRSSFEPSQAVQA